MNFNEPMLIMSSAYLVLASTFSLVLKLGSKLRRVILPTELDSSGGGGDAKVRNLVLYFKC